MLARITHAFLYAGYTEIELSWEGTFTDLDVAWDGAGKTAIGVTAVASRPDLEDISWEVYRDALTGFWRVMDNRTSLTLATALTPAQAILVAQARLPYVRHTTCDPRVLALLEQPHPEARDRELEMGD